MKPEETVENYGKTHIYMVGMDDNPQPGHIEGIIKSIKHDNIFSGGKRHYEIVRPFLPADAVWIEIKAPIDAVLAEYSRLIQEDKVIVSFVSGDPFFFGFASTVRKKLSGVSMKVFPYFNSLQMFAHHEQIAYENMHAVSVTGRPWHELDRALLEYRPLIGVLTDRVHTPDAIAKRMMEYHLDKDYTMRVAEHLGNPEKEKIYKTYSIEEISEMSFTNPNCVLLMKDPDSTQQRPALGIPDTKFVLLNNRTKMITKAPIRVIDLSLLELHDSRSFWDIGACTGSVSIEARRQYPHLDIRAFEVREECESIIRANARLHSAPGINLHIGNFLDQPIEENTTVDAVFIGGHGGKLKEIVRKVISHLDNRNGKIVFNSVSEESCNLFREAVKENGLKLHSEMNITVDTNNPITIFCATSKDHV